MAVPQAPPEHLERSATAPLPSGWWPAGEKASLFGPAACASGTTDIEATPVSLHPGRAWDEQPRNQSRGLWRARCSEMGTPGSGGGSGKPTGGNTGGRPEPTSPAPRPRSRYARAVGAGGRASMPAPDRLRRREILGGADPRVRADGVTLTSGTHGLAGPTASNVLVVATTRRWSARTLRPFSARRRNPVGHGYAGSSCAERNSSRLTWRCSMVSWWRSRAISTSWHVCFVGFRAARGRVGLL
jgi:hypothetical protein